MNKNLLVSKMKLHGDNQEDLAEYIGISLTTFNTKLNETGGAEFRQGEIQKIKEKYDLTSEEVDAIFFASSVS
jgi:DNA-binding XRE family transcriptional regulator